MKVNKKDMLLYAVTDRTWLRGRSLKEAVEESLKGGVTFLQLREKELSEEEFLREAEKIKEVVKRYRVPFIINDSVDVAIRCDADGVHVGQKDTAVLDVRKRIGENKILGVSAQTVEQAVAAEKAGADYLGVGAVFSTSTKPDAVDVSFDTLKEICSAVSIPVVAIGGIGRENIMRLRGSGIDGVAVVSAIYAGENIKEAAGELCSLSNEMIKDVSL